MKAREVIQWLVVGLIVALTLVCADHALGADSTIVYDTTDHGVDDYDALNETSDMTSHKMWAFSDHFGIFVWTQSGAERDAPLLIIDHYGSDGFTRNDQIWRRSDNEENTYFIISGLGDSAIVSNFDYDDPVFYARVVSNVVGDTGVFSGTAEGDWAGDAGFMGQIGDKLIVIQPKDGTDSTIAWGGDDSYPPSGFTAMDTIGVEVGSGLSINFPRVGEDGILIWDGSPSGNQNFLWFDTTNGFTNMSTGMADFANYGGGDWIDFVTHDIVHMRGDTGLIVYQADVAAGADSLVAIKFYVSGTPDIVPIDTSVIASPADLTDGRFYNPGLTYIKSTDTVAIVYTVSDGSDVDVVVKYSGDCGETWGPATVIRDGSGGDDVHHLQTFPHTHKSGDTTNVLAAWAVDATGTSYIEMARHMTWGDGGSPAAETSNPKFRSGPDLPFRNGPGATSVRSGP